MYSRCYTPEDIQFPNYGGRGIDNHGPYSPSNCRYVERKINDRNRRTNVYYEFMGKLRTCPEILEIYNPHKLKVRAFQFRLKKGFPMMEALNTPYMRKRIGQQ
jgi:hypothetical protein